MLLKSIYWYPVNKAKQAGKAAIELIQKYPPKPEISERLVVGASQAIRDVIQAESIAKIKKGKLTEAIKYATKIALEFAEKVEGLSYQIIPLMEFEEAIQIIGL